MYSSCYIMYLNVLCVPQKHCDRQKANLRIRFKPSLFQHVGTHSSLAGKIQKLKVIFYILANIFIYVYMCVIIVYICNPPAEWSASGLCSFLFRLSKLQITVPRRQLIRAHLLINQHVSLLCLYSLQMKSARNRHDNDPLVLCRIGFCSQLLNTSEGPAHRILPPTFIMIHCSLVIHVLGFLYLCFYIHLWHVLAL